MIAAMLIAITVLACACSVTDRWPRVCIEISDMRADSINIPLREGYQFAEDAYDIAGTEAGYDIVIHVERAGESATRREAEP